MKKLVPNCLQLLLLVVFLLGSQLSIAQSRANTDKKEIPQAALDHLKQNKEKLRLTEDDLAELELSSITESKRSGIKHLYLKQLHQGIEIYGAITNVNMTKDGKVINVGNRFHKNISEKAKMSRPEKASLTADDAVAAAARHLNTSLKEPLAVKEKLNSKSKSVVFSNGGISLEPIPAKLIYQPMEDGSLRLAWEVSIYELDGQNWWNIRVDAQTGAVLDKDNMVAHCEFDNNGPGGDFLHQNHKHTIAAPSAQQELELPIPYLLRSEAASMARSGTYNVFPMPVESPTHGNRTVVSESAANAVASPSGWHTAGATSYTITRGNNVYAYEDPDNTGYVGAPQDMYGYSPDGGAAMVFNYPIDFRQEPVAYRDAAITNLFYWNNLIHDVWYQYGFDEESGNFQTFNYDKGGLAGDHVMAEAQDSRNISTTRNNANFATPADGTRPRMQMYLWSPKPDQSAFTVVSPSSIAGAHMAAFASFGPALTATPITGKLVLADEATGCAALTNPDAINGNIAILYRGGCNFTVKVQNAEAAGAIAVVVININPGSPTSMGGTPSGTINIPSMMISDVVGANVRAALDAGQEVIVSLKNEGGPEIDGDFDNGIIVHEYGHGISNRLTGGPNTTSCLGNADQAGEGWSDWFGLMMTIEPGDSREDVRGIGTYASGQPTTGSGIRPAPYSTDFAVNGFTYAATNDPAISRPHGIGFIFATTLWEMTWDLIDKYGYDPDLYNGTGGNNMAMQLVIDGLKLQPCRPGFVDARNAILLADQVNYGGANQQLIWTAFARRGLGFSASQGSNADRFDQVEAFDMPAIYICDAPTVTAQHTSDVPTGSDATTLYLGYGSQSAQLLASSNDAVSYSWSPAAGLNNATIANPIFTPSMAGSYTFEVETKNANGCAATAEITINVIDIRCGRNKVLICHNGTSQCVSPASVRAHLAHGDQLGDCGTGVSPATSNVSFKALTNPFSSRTTLEFTLEQEGNYRLEVVNRDGVVVAVVAQGKSQAGETHQTQFDSGNLQSDIYIARLTTDNEVKMVRLLLMR